MKTSSLFSLIALASFASLAACSGETLDVGTKSTQQAGSAAANPASRSPALDDICDGAHGPADPVTKLGEIKTHLAGRWYRCDTTPGTPWTKTGQGLEIVPTDNDGGTYYALDFDTAGDATREQGLDSSGPYFVSLATASTVTEDTDDTPFSQMFISSQSDINAGPTSTGMDTSHYFEFETNPRRMRMDGKIWFVSADAAQ